ncbi:MAG: hypothetical protein CFE32_02300 [Alphaproteobacteria bacterium PA3]|nr:MAG: hypothetical protein CFE32_02300 [Alphaproteobacteria bacterium PA3]
MSIVALLLYLAVSPPQDAPVVEVETATQIRQSISAPRSAPTDASQVGGTSREAAGVATGSAQIDVGTNGGRKQLVTQSAEQPSDRAASLIQVSPTQQPRAPVTQVSPAGPRLGTVPALSNSAQGRVVALASVGGKDRCDPGSEAARSEDCARVIETRSAEFTEPEPAPLSAEQALMAMQSQSTSSSNDLDAAARRLSSGRADESLAELAVANLALKASTDEKKEADTKGQAPTAVDALVAQIIAQANGAMPPN